MYKSKSIKTLIIFVIISILSSAIITVNAASASASVTSNIVVGGTGNASISTNAPGGFFQGTITSSNTGVVRLSKSDLRISVPDDSITASPSTSVSMSGVSAGTSTITINISGEDFDGNPFSLNKSYTVTVSKAQSSGGGTTKPPVPQAPKAPQETEAERQARLEREQAAAKEKAQKIPLISKIDLVSDSDKRRDQVISSFTPEEGKFDFEYTLPTFIEDVKFSIDSTEGASITVEDTYKIGEVTEVVIKASKDDISQEYKVKLTPDIAISTTVDEIAVYSDSLLNSKMEEFGFTIVDVETVAGATKAFSKGSLVLQMIVDSGRGYEFQKLSEDGQVIDNGQLIIADGKTYFVSVKTTEEVNDFTLYGDGLQTVNLEIPQYIADIDETLVVKANLKGWVYEDGVVLQGSDEEGNLDFIRIDNDKNVNQIVVAFDKNTSNMLPIMFLIVSALLLAVSSTFAYYVVKNKKNHTSASAY